MDKFITAVTKKGSALAIRLAPHLNAACRVPLHFMDSPVDPRGYQIPVKQVIKEAFPKYAVLILIMAASGAVRSIAPLLRDQRTDPAVVVLDEEGRFVISLLSGPLGEGNQLAREIAALTGGASVITTATEVSNLPRLDSLAQQYHLRVENVHCLTEFTGAIVNGEPVVFWDRWGVGANWPENVRVVTEAQITLRDRERKLLIAGYEDYPGLPQGISVMALRPACLVVGVSCLKGTPGVRLVGALRRYFRERYWATKSIQALVTLDVLAVEPGLLELCHELKVPLKQFSARQLQTALLNAEGRTVDFSDPIHWLNEVPEAAALSGVANGRLIGSKVNLGPISIAVASVSGRS